MKNMTADAIFPRRLLSYYIKRANTSWTHSVDTWNPETTEEIVCSHQATVLLHLRRAQQSTAGVYTIQNTMVMGRDENPGCFSGSRTSMVRLTPKEGFWNYLKYSFNRLLKISLRLRYRAPDPFFWPKPGPHPCFLFDINC